MTTTHKPLDPAAWEGATAGPWESRERGDGGVAIHDAAHGQRLASMTYSNSDVARSIPLSEREANAALIAAAPRLAAEWAEMRRVLATIVENLHRYDDGSWFVGGDEQSDDDDASRMIAEARALLARVEGGSNG